MAVPPATIRRLPAVVLHGAVAALDLAWAAGEGAMRLAGLFFGVLLGDKALGAAVEGLLRFLFVGNLWWPLLHVVALLGVVLRTDRKGWGVGVVLIAGRSLFLWVNGRPYFDIAGASWSPGFVRFFWCVLVLLAVAQFVAQPPQRYVIEDDDSAHPSED